MSGCSGDELGHGLRDKKRAALHRDVAALPAVSAVRAARGFWKVEVQQVTPALLEHNMVVPRRRVCCPAVSGISSLAVQADRGTRCEMQHSLHLQLLELETHITERTKQCDHHGSIIAVFYCISEHI